MLTLRVYLTRRQVHAFFPRLRERFPWYVRQQDGTVVADLRERLEMWPLALADPDPPRHQISGYTGRAR